MGVLFLCIYKSLFYPKIPVNFAYEYETIFSFNTITPFLSGCANREDPEILKPFLDEHVKKFTTDAGQVTINNFKVTGSKNIETAIEGTPATITSTAFTCDSASKKIHTGSVAQHIHSSLIL